MGSMAGSAGSRVGSGVGGSGGVGPDDPEPAGGREDDLLFLLTVAWPLVSSASSNTCGVTGGGAGADGNSFAGGKSSLAVSWC